MRAGVALRLAGVATLALLAVVVLGTGSIRGDRVTATFAAGITPPADDLRALLPVKPPSPPPAPRYLIGRVNRPIDTSAGVVQPTTPLGSPTWVLVLRRHGEHARALVPSMPHAAPVRLDLRGMTLHWTRVAISIDLSSRRLEIINGRKVVGRFRVAVGSPSTPTPTGRFFVTDRVTFPPGSVYGTFALGLAAHQTAHLPGGWSGGNQIAIHGTDAPSSIGHAVSLGCVRAGPHALRLLQRLVPLGAPVVIRQ
jgi:L,D-transpeptidase-like protein